MRIFSLVADILGGHIDSKYSEKVSATSVCGVGWGPRMNQMILKTKETS